MKKNYKEIAKIPFCSRCCVMAKIQGIWTRLTLADKRELIRRKAFYYTRCPSCCKKTSYAGGKA